jgi:hypothetical protein
MTGHFFITVVTALSTVLQSFFLRSFKSIHEDNGVVSGWPSWEMGEKENQTQKTQSWKSRLFSNSSNFNLKNQKDVKQHHLHLVLKQQVPTWKRLIELFLFLTQQITIDSAFATRNLILTGTTLFDYRTFLVAIVYLPLHIAGESGKKKSLGSTK